MKTKFLQFVAALGGIAVIALMVGHGVDAAEYGGNKMKIDGISLAEGKDFVAVGGDSAFDFSASTGTFKTPTGTATLGGSLSLAAGKDLTFAAGAGSMVMNSTVTNASDKGIELVPIYTGGATDTLTYTVVDIAAASPANAAGTDTYNGIKLGNLTDPGATITSVGINIGTGWDTGLLIQSAMTLGAAMTVSSGTDITAAGGASDLDFSLSSGIFKTPSGQTTLTGAVSLASGVDMVAAGGAADLDYSLSSGIFKTPTGQGTINGALSIASGIDIVAAGGAADLDYALSSGIFKTPTGAGTLSGDTAMVAGKHFTLPATSQFKMTEDANACKGQSAAMTAGAITISTTCALTASRVFLTHAGSNVANIGMLSVGTITNGTSFVINSSNGADTDTVNWFIIN